MARSGSSCASATSPPARTSRRSPKSASASRCGPATARAWSSPRSTTSGAAIARATTGSATPPADAVTLYEETEELGFSVGVGKSTDKSLIVISTGDNATSEVRFVPADDPSRPLTLISARKPNREYHVDAAHGKLWIRTNDDHVNFRLAEADIAEPGRMAHGDRGLGPGLSDRRHRPIATIWRSAAASTGSTSCCCAPTPARKRASRSPRPATPPSSPAIPSSRRTPIASAIPRWSRRRPFTIITRTATGWRREGPGNPVGL